jgi:hypothetical protein
MNPRKDELIKLSHNRQTPGDARPEDFEPESEQLEFSGACGDSHREYNELLQGGSGGKARPKNITSRGLVSESLDESFQKPTFTGRLLF